MGLHAVPPDAAVTYGRLLPREQQIGLQIVESAAQNLKLDGRQVSGYLRGGESARHSRCNNDAAAMEGDRRNLTICGSEGIVQIRAGKHNLQLLLDGPPQIQ